MEDLSSYEQERLTRIRENQSRLGVLACTNHVQDHLFFAMGPLYGLAQLRRRSARVPPKERVWLSESTCDGGQMSWASDSRRPRCSLHCTSRPSVLRAPTKVCKAMPLDGSCTVAGVPGLCHLDPSSGTHLA